jgi:flagellin-like protein
MEKCGVSPVVGTILLLAITIVLAGVIVAIVPNLWTRSSLPVANIRIIKVDQSGYRPCARWGRRACP